MKIIYFYAAATKKKKTEAGDAEEKKTYRCDLRAGRAELGRALPG